MTSTWIVEYQENMTTWHPLERLCKLAQTKSPLFQVSINSNVLGILYWMAQVNPIHVWYHLKITTFQQRIHHPSKSTHILKYDKIITKISKSPHLAHQNTMSSLKIVWQRLGERGWLVCPIFFIGYVIELQWAKCRTVSARWE